MSRTTSSLVAGIIEVDSAIDLTPFITAAGSLVDVVAEESSLTSTQLELVERWLSAHFYAIRDPRAVSEKAGPVAASFQSAVALNLASSHYGQMAMTLDTSGVLAGLSGGNRKTVSLHWLGTES
jgi:hypothetical protein